MEELEEKFRSQLLHKRVMDIEMYNINEHYYMFDPESQWVIDGGVEIILEDAHFSFGWDRRNEGYDYSFDRSLKEMIDDLPHFSVGAKEVAGISSLIGKTITDLKIQWHYYLTLNDEGELTGDKTYIPIDIVLTFDSRERIQLAFIDFEIKKRPFALKNPTYDLAGQVLLSLNNTISIRNTYIM